MNRRQQAFLSYLIEATYWTAICLITAMLVVFLASCGGSQKEKALKTALVAVDAARDGFVAWDLRHQRTIVKETGSREQAEMLLREHRAARADVVATFQVAYAAIAAAALDLRHASLADIALIVSDVQAAVAAFIKGRTGDDDP